MNISHLKYPPIKYNLPKKLTEKILFCSQVDYFGHDIDKFIMVSTKKSEFGKFAQMKCFPELISRDGLNNVPSLYVLFLSSNCSGSGFGTAMLDFVRVYSKKIGCNGFFHLTSDTAFMPQRVPHPFYRKYGMNTGIPKIDKKIDRFIESGKNATSEDFNMIDMYYPPVENKQGVFKKLFDKSLDFGFKALFGIWE